MQKRLLILILIFTMIYTPVVNAKELNTPITIYINGQFVYSDVPAVEMNGYNYVAIRPIFEVLGAESITYREADKCVTIIDKGITLEFIVGKKEVYIDGFRFDVEFETVFYKNRIMVPIEFIAQNYGLNLAVDEKTSIIYASNSDLAVKTNATSAQIYTVEDILWLARIVHVEVGYLSHEVKLAVANVVLNRKKSPIFPDSIKDIVFQKGQFPPAYKDGFIALVPTDDDIYIAKLALSGENNISTCLYFNNRKFSTKANDFYKSIEGEYFYY